MATDSLTYTVADAWGQRTGTVTVTIAAVGETFVNAIDDKRTTPQGTPLLISPLANDQFSPELGPLRIAPGSVTDPNPAGTAAIEPNQLQVLFSPAPGFTGIATFNYEAQSTIELLQRSVATVRVTVG